MADAWTVSDHLLFRMLRAWVNDIPRSVWWTLELYVNNHVPQPGDIASDYQLPSLSQWPEYEGVKLFATNWSEPQVTTHVATTSQPGPFVFVYPSGIGLFTIYGYIVLDGLNNLQWAEMFTAPIVPSYPGGLELEVSFNLSVAPDVLDLVGIEERDDDDADEPFEVGD